LKIVYAGFYGDETYYTSLFINFHHIIEFVYMTLYLIRMKLPFRMVRENNISLFNLHPNVPRKLVSKSCGLVRILEHPTLPNLPTHTPFKKK
jgi:hypothetical protein